MHRKHLVDCPSDVHFMKNLKFAIARSQIPLMLRAMKFSALAMLTFSRVRKFRYVSFFFHFH